MKILKISGIAIMIVGGICFFFGMLAVSRTQELKKFSQIESYFNNPRMYVNGVSFYFKENAFDLSDEEIKTSKGNLKFMTIENKHIPIVMLDKKDKFDGILVEPKPLGMWWKHYDIDTIKNRFPEIQFEPIFLVQQSGSAVKLVYNGGMLALLVGGLLTIAYSLLSIYRK